MPELSSLTGQPFFPQMSQAAALSGSMRATRMSLLANRWLEDRPEARVLHVFERSCILITAGGCILSLISLGLESGPFSLVVETEHAQGRSSRPLFEDVKAESAVGNDASGLQIGSLKIFTQTAEVWDPKLPRGLFIGQPLEQGLASMWRLMDRSAPAQCLAHAVRDDGSGAADRRVRRAWREIRQGISDHDRRSISAGARRAAGVGIGLTPAGDDFLLGVLIALWLKVLNPERLMASIVSAAAGRTSSLSAAWLKAAGQGQAGEVWHDLTSALHWADEDLALTAGRRILEVGNTSGADALTGFLITMDYLGQTAGQ